MQRSSSWADILQKKKKKKQKKKQTCLGEQGLSIIIQYFKSICAHFSFILISEMLYFFQV